MKTKFNYWYLLRIVIVLASSAIPVGGLVSLFDSNVGGWIAFSGIGVLGLLTAGIVVFALLYKPKEKQ